MFNHIRRILSKKVDNTSPSSSNSENRIHIAACVVLLEAAHADNECTEDELDHVIDVMQKRFDISKEYAVDLVDIAHQQRSEAIDFWQFTNEINQQFTRAEKMEILESVWQIIFLDDYLEKHEDYFVHKLANLFRLRHSELIEAKMKVRQCIK